MYLAKDASATASSLCADLPMALAWGRSRVRPNSARLLVRLAAAHFLSNCVLDKPFYGNVDHIFRMSNVRQADFRSL